MGMQGAAIATIIACAVEVAAACYVFCLERKVCLRPWHLYKFDRSYLRGFSKNVLPVMANELIWSSGNSTLLMIMGRMGRAFVTATSITMQFAQIFATGLSNAIAVVIGDTIGEENHAPAQSIAQGAAIIGVGFGLFVGGASTSSARSLLKCTIYHLLRVKLPWLSWVLPPL